MVLTPQMLVNALDAGEAHFSQLALLVRGLWRRRGQLANEGWGTGPAAGVQPSCPRHPAPRCPPAPGSLHPAPSLPPCPPLCQVLDECHHATGRHAASQVLRHYHASGESTQVGSCRGGRGAWPSGTWAG